MRKGKKSAFVVILFVVLIISSLGVLGVGSIYIYARKNIDFSADESMFLAAKESGITRFFYDGNYGEGEYSPKEYCIFQQSSIKKQWYPYEKIGDNLKAAFISAEDRSFFKHHGVDVGRTGFALFNYIFHIKPKFGGSTITQQVIKNISGDDEQTLSRKISEIIRATHIENTHSKEEIFEVYLNIVPMGDGILGVGMASEYYFGKEPCELDVWEAATLVGITNAPTHYNPRSNKENCLKKRNNVLYAMRENGAISEKEYNDAINRELVIINSDNINAVDSWFVETVCDDLARDLAKQQGITQNAARVLIMNGGLSVYTTVNPQIQRTLEDYFSNTSNFPDSASSGLDFSMVIADSKNGNLVGIVGGVGKKQGNRLLNNALVPHTPGSSLKPIALYAPLINKKKVHWATVFDDVPVYFTENKQGDVIPYPKNYPAVYDGLTTVDNALRLSKNTVAVRLYELLGRDSIFASLRDDFGFETLVESKMSSSGKKITDKAVSPLALGQLTYGVSLRNLTTAYTVFPSDGQLSFSRSYIKVFDSQGKLLIDNKPKTKKIYSKESARIMNKLLMRVTDSGTAKSITLCDIIDTAGKTGTSGNDMDRLFVGYTPYYTAGIWCGYNGERKSIGKQNISHLQIWDEVMKEIHEYRLEFNENVEGFSTEGLEYLPYCRDSGELYCDNCMLDPRKSRLEYGYFTYDNKPKKLCDRHVICLYDKSIKDVASEESPKEELILISLLDIPERKIPTDIAVKDAKYVLQADADSLMKRGSYYDIPYFINTLNEGKFAKKGKGRR